MRNIKIAFMVMLVLALATILTSPAAASPVFWYTAHVQDKGWLDSVWDGEQAGTTGESRRLEALSFTDPLVEAKGHVQNLGWLPSSSSIVGTTGKSLRLEAVKISARFPGWTVKCQAHVQNLGWLPVVGNGELCGTTGKSLRLEAVKLWLEPTN